MKKPQTNSQAAPSPIEPDPRTLAVLAARLMATPWFREQVVPSLNSLYPGEMQRRAADEAYTLFNECAAAIGLKDCPINMLTRNELRYQFMLSDGEEYRPAEMGLLLADLAVQMLSVGTPRTNAVSQALDLLAATHWKVSALSNAAEPPFTDPIPLPPKWPATLKDFYRLVVKARDKADAQPRFRQYLQSALTLYLERLLPGWSEDYAQKRADDTFRELQEKGFDRAAWLRHTKEYYSWWAHELHRTKQAAGRRGYEAKVAARNQKSASEKARIGQSSPPKKRKKTRR